MQCWKRVSTYIIVFSCKILKILLFVIEETLSRNKADAKSKSLSDMLVRVDRKKMT